MHFSRMAIVSLCAVALAGSVLAQAKEPKGGFEVLKMIPAGNMGVLVVNDVKKTTDDVDQFLTALGVMDDMKKSGMDKGVLNAMLQAAQMEAGFRAEGGFAATVLDPQQFGVDLEKVAKGFGRRATSGEDETQKIPFAIYIPAKSMKELFANYEVTKPEGSKYQLVDLRMGPVYAVEANGYVIISPLAKVLDAVTAVKKSAADELSKEQAAAVASNEISVLINMKITGPWYDKLLKKQQEQMDQMKAFLSHGGPEAIFFNVYGELNAMARKQIADWDTVTIGGRFVPEGIVAEMQMTFVKDSPSGKALAEMKPMDKSRLSMLPANNYIFAMDFSSQGGPASLKMRQEMIERIMGVITTLDDAQKKQIQQIIEGVAEQVNGGQLVIGGGPEGKGAVALTMVLQVKDSAQYKKLVMQGVDLSNKIMSGPEATTKPADTAEEDGPAGMPKVSLSYKTGAAKVGDASIDAVVVNLPAAMTERHKADMTKIIGDDQIRFMIAAPAKDTVVITFGGAIAQMEATLKTMAKGDGIDLSKAAISGMKYMPEKPQMIGAFNVANLLKVIKKASGQEDVPVLKIDAPILMSGSATGNNSTRGVFFVPTAIIKEIIDSFKAEREKHMHRAQEVETQPAGTDF